MFRLIFSQDIYVMSCKIFSVTVGRGFVFPYAAASTHAAYDYRTSCKGKWEYSRNIQPYPVYDIGITGATIHTEDSTASFKLVFNKALKRQFQFIKIYCKRSPESYNLKLKASGITSPLYIDCNSFNEKLYIGIKFLRQAIHLSLLLIKRIPLQKYFECYGLMIETNEDNGVLYNSVGINGAGLASIMKENLLLYQLSEIKPDLVVLDLGLNDFYKVTFNSVEIEKNLCNIIDIIQRASPDASIILCSEAGCILSDTGMRQTVKHMLSLCVKLLSGKAVLFMIIIM